MSWHQIYDLPPSDPVERKNWTRAIVQNRLFMYRQDDLYILELDTASVPGEPQIIAHTPVFANMSGVQGIFQARGRLGLWDQENSIYWSDIDNLLDFTPSLETLANVIQVDDIKGKISHVVQAQEGFIIYTNANIVGMFEVPDNKVFRAIELDDNLGVFSSDHVCVGMGGEHIIWSNGMLYKVNANRDPRRQAVEPLFPEVSDTLKNFQGYPRLYHHNNRYFVIGLTSKDFVPGKNVIQRRKVEGNTYFQPQHVFNMGFGVGGWDIQFMQSVGLNKPADYIEPASVLAEQACGPRTLYIPETVPDYPLGYPEDTPSFLTQGAEPPPQCTNVLWAYLPKAQPRLLIEQSTVTGDKGCWSFDVGGNTAIELESYQLDYAFWQSGVKENWRSYLNPSRKLDYESKYPVFSFSSYSLILAQIEEWRKRYNSNRNQASILTKDEALWEGYLCDVPVQDPSINSVLLDATPVFPVQTSYSSVRNQLDTDITQYTNTRVVQNDSGTIQSTYSRTLQRTVTRYEIGQEPYPDWTVGSSGTQARTKDVNGTAHLVGTEDHAMEKDIYFQKYFYPDSPESSGQWHDPILDLGQTYPTQAADLWGTVMNLAGYGDGCSYAKASSHAARRAWNKGSTVDDLLEYKNELKEVDPADPAYGFYYTRARKKTTYAVDVDRLLEEAFTVPTDGGYRGLYGYAPQRELVQIAPVAKLVHPDGIDPSPYLTQFYQEAEQKYPSMNRADALVAVYEENGWVASAANSTPDIIPPSSILLEDKGNGYLEPETWDKFNGQVDSGFFSELVDKNSLCGREIFSEHPVEPPPVDITPSTIVQPPTQVDSQFGTDAWRVVQPPTVVLEGSSSTGATYPIYNVHLIYDEHLKKWGICIVPCEVFISMRPENETAYNPTNTETTSALTYRDFFSALGGLLPSGLTVVWNDQPDQSYLVLGKVGLQQEGYTTWTELEVEFGDIPNGLIGMEFSEDGKLINPYQMRLKQAKEIIEKMYLASSGRHANILIFGHFRVIQAMWKAFVSGDR